MIASMWMQKPKNIGHHWQIIDVTVTVNPWDPTSNMSIAYGLFSSEANTASTTVSGHPSGGTEKHKVAKKP